MGTHDWHRPLEDNPYADAQTASIPPMHTWTCSKCGAVRYVEVGKGKPELSGCPDEKPSAGSVTVLDDEPPAFTTVAASTFDKYERVYVDSGTGEVTVETDWKAKCRALELELKQVNGAMKNLASNWAQAESKLERQRKELDERKRKLDERDGLAVEDVAAGRIEYWRKRAESAREEAEAYRERLSKVLDILHEADNVGREL